MSSGVKVSDKVKDIFNEMKVVKSDSNQMDRIRIVVLGIANGFINVEKIVKEGDLCSSSKDGFCSFKEELMDGKCCYILYDCHYETKESKKEEIVFTTWCSDSASIKHKMCFSASKDALRKCFGGIKHNFQFNELADCGDEDNFADMVGKGTIICLEGRQLGCGGKGAKGKGHGSHDQDHHDQGQH